MRLYTQCSAGKFNSIKAQSSCSKCPSGAYSTYNANIGSIDMTNSKDCPTVTFINTLVRHSVTHARQVLAL